MHKVQEFDIDLLQVTRTGYFEISSTDEVKVLKLHIDRRSNMLTLFCLVPLVSYAVADEAVSMEDTCSIQTFHLVRSDSPFFEESFEYIGSFTHAGELYHLFEV